jgi:NADPH:quinone reductase-like Zn-dependent oxidoreductase
MPQRAGSPACRSDSRAVPAEGEVLVRAHYAGINPVDWKLQEARCVTFPATPGADFSGEIVVVCRF